MAPYLSDLGVYNSIKVAIRGAEQKLLVLIFLCKINILTAETQILKRGLLPKLFKFAVKYFPSKLLSSLGRAAKLNFDWLRQLCPFSSNFSLCLGPFFLQSNQVYFHQNIEKSVKTFILNSNKT